jgi:protocatechuate 3,4-dioxygenase alpha subunit
MPELGLTPSQTVGPFYAIGLPWPGGPFAVADDAPGAVWLRGRVIDGAGEPVPDALIETWQADPLGIYHHPDDPRADQDSGPGAETSGRGGFRGFARCPTDVDGRYAILILKPGRAPGPRGTMQAPHIAMSVFARGLLNRVVTRVYFPDEGVANAADPILACVPDAATRATLIAAEGGDGYVFDIRLQGDGETVFFTI